MSDTKHKIIIAVDGFSSCGKSTFAKAIARRLGYIFIDTGAMYRAVTLYALEHGAIRSGIVDEDAVVRLLDQITITFRFNPERGASDIYVNGDLAEGKIRTIEVSNCVSRVSAIPAVRRKLVAMQQEMGRRRGVVMDGRDIGTVVFPDAELKIFMTADPKVRACRRYDELRAKGDNVSLEEIERNVRERDKADMSRAISPLRQADDAVVLDNSCMTVEQQMAWFMTELERINKYPSRATGTVKDLRIEIDDKSGFCFGVVRAISEAEKALAGGETVYSLGDIVHNRIEVQRLEKLGLSTVTHADMPRLTGRRLFIRAHGEPPTTYARAAELGIEVIDATCPVVARLQARVVKAHERMRPAGGQVVILGKRGHAEVVGLTGQVPDRTIVVEGEEDLSQIDFTRPVYFLSQTTQSIALFEALGAEMRRRAANPADVHIDDTICRQVSSREQHLQEFARRFDAVVFVCGRKSSNGRVLFEVCRTANPRTCNIEEAAEIDPAWFEGAESVGICGATSTPKWLMQEVADRIGKIGKGK